jgi:hypothetical protein
MVKKKCLGCVSLLPIGIEANGRLDVLHCTYTKYGTIPNCVCAGCMLKSICTATCLDFIDKLFQCKHRIKLFDVSLEMLKRHILGV